MGQVLREPAGWTTPGSLQPPIPDGPREDASEAVARSTIPVLGGSAAPSWNQSPHIVTGRWLSARRWPTGFEPHCELHVRYSRGTQPRE